MSEMFSVVAVGDYDPRTDTVSFNKDALDALASEAWAKHPNNTERTHVRIPVTAQEADLIDALSVTGTIMNFNRCDVPEALWLKLRSYASATANVPHNIRRVSRDILRKVDHERNGLWS